MKKRILSLLLCLVLCFSFTFVVSAAESAEVESNYPCYCDSCVQSFNSQFSKLDCFSDYPVSFSSGNESFNGLFLFIYFYTFDNTFHFIFCTSYSISGDYFRFYNATSFTTSSPVIDLSSSSFSSLGSFYEEINSLKLWLYSHFTDSSISSTVLNQFNWPLHQSPGQTFGSDFPSFLSSAWSGLTNFIVDNKLVLLIFIIPVAFALIGLIKRGFR